MAMTDKLQYVLANDTGVCLLDCTKAFEGLSDTEKLYTHYLSRASWYGGLIVLAQTSPESPGIFLLLHRLFKAQSVEELSQLATKQGFSDDEVQAFLIYAAGFYSNSGNYKSFGDTKFIPNVPKEKVEKLIFSSAACQSDTDGIKSLWQQVGDAVYSLNPRRKELGLAPKGTTTYFSSNCDTKDGDIVQEFLTSKNLSAYNTRLFKTVDADTGHNTYEVRLASVELDDGPIPGINDAHLLGTHQFTPKDAESPITFQVSRGDYSKLLSLCCENLKKAKSYAANKAQEDMLEEYIKSFRTGSIPAHKDGSRHWIKDKGPIVESYIGFIESYRDPTGVRGEFEGFVAVVNKEMSEKFIELVNNAEHLLPLLPWPATYEKDTFLKPDFTSLDVVAFSGSGVPAGINIPNYDEIRQTEGFKNVSLGNVLSSGYKDTKITFLAEEDKHLYTKWKLGSFEVQVGLHELLGHGSGKLFMENKDGKLNFDKDNVKNLLTTEKVTNWYKHNETFFGRFTSMSPPYEECRAECVGLYLCLSTDVLRIFGYTHNEADDVVYVNWLNMVRAGLMSLEFYSPENRAWGQAHMQARFAILRVLLEAGESFVRIEKITGEDGKIDLIIRLDRSKIIGVGKPAIGTFLNKLQVYKSVGDVEGAKKMFGYYTDVNDNKEPHFLSLRETVLRRKLPRKMLVQHNTVLEGEKVVLKEYEANAAGMVQSVVERFPSDNIDTILEEIWTKDRHHFIGLD